LDTFLQFWGGGFYLLNKIFFSRLERSSIENKRKWQISAWTVYLIGLPAWVIIFVTKHNWMAAAVEAGGAAAMVLGLVISVRGVGKAPKWLDFIALVSAILGIIYSLYDFGGINTINQVFELGVVVGFLCGTYLLAKQKSIGYLFFALMNGSNASLMHIQEYPWLALQQIISLCFVADAYFMQVRTSRLRVSGS